VGPTYGILGGGRQGTAAAYDMARLGNAEKVIIADIDIEAARKSVARVNRLIGIEIAVASQLDVTDYGKSVAFLKRVDSFLSAVPYWHNPSITRAAIEAGACMTDLGGN
jgi:lysine 6-dehydrogenase